VRQPEVVSSGGLAGRDDRQAAGARSSMPPEEIVAAPPPLTVVALATPLKKTTWVPPLPIVAPRALPPEETVSLPPPLTMLALAVPPERMISKPLTSALSVMPPELNRTPLVLRITGLTAAAVGNDGQEAAADDRPARHAAAENALLAAKDDGAARHAAEDILEAISPDARGDRGAAVGDRLIVPCPARAVLTVEPPDETTAVMKNPLAVVETARPPPRTSGYHCPLQREAGADLARADDISGRHGGFSSLPRAAG